MPKMTPQQFVAKWSQIQQKETAVSQSHFNDICQLVGHPTPLEYDPSGERFSFETQTAKPDGAKGFADVYFREKFIWEYKGPHKDLDKAYQQLQLYREALENPPLLITSDIRTIVIHTNFNNYPIQQHSLTLDDILSGDGVQKLTWAFFEPERFKPARTRQNITKATADSLLNVANEMKKHRDLLGDGRFSNEQLAHFLVRLLFALFAEDMGLLPDNLFTQIVKARGGNYGELRPVLQELFDKMRSGGIFGMWPIRHFNGTLFDDNFVPDIPHDLGRLLMQAAEQDWAQVDPSIFGTLFERVIDEDKRAQLGAHYTSEEDIMLIVEPVLMAPLRQKWDQVRREANLNLTGRPSGPLPDTLNLTGRPSGPLPDTLNLTGRPPEPLPDRTIVGDLSGFSAELASIRVLDPACGSGNFLYVALRQLLGLQKEVIAFAARKGLPDIELTVSPEQLYGIEINPYAHELAQITVWIGYLQWRSENGFGDINDPILRPLHNIQRMDAILTYDENGRPSEPAWPAADVIIGNPPFLGGQKINREFGSRYTKSIRSLYKNRIPDAADLVTFWFERARSQIEKGKSKRAGLIATQNIRGEASRPVLDQVQHDCNIFMAWSDRPWVLDGAAVRVSIVGFDNGSELSRTLDGIPVQNINSDLSTGLDLTKASSLQENEALGFMGIIRNGPFELSEEEARTMLDAQNQEPAFANDQVVKRWIRGLDLTDRPKNTWIIDFGIEMSLQEAGNYELPLQYVRKHVKPIRDKKSADKIREEWWLFEGRRSGMREALADLKRYIATTLVGKHRLFKWFDTNTIPDARVVVIGRDDDYFFGVLHSKVHELWSLGRAARHGVGNDPTYNVTTCLASFPFPWPPGQEPGEADPRVAAIAHWARALVQWRDAWLNPPRDGLYAGLGPAYDKLVKNRTLTNLYNGLVYYRETHRRVGSQHAATLQNGPKLFDRTEFDKVTRKSVTPADIQELDDIHTALDTAVLDAYGWPHTLTDEQILERLLALNLARAAGPEAA